MAAAAGANNDFIDLHADNYYVSQNVADQFAEEDEEINPGGPNAGGPPRIIEIRMDGEVGSRVIFAGGEDLSPATRYGIYSTVCQQYLALPLPPELPPGSPAAEVQARTNERATRQREHDIIREDIISPAWIERAMREAREFEEEEKTREIERRARSAFRGSRSLVFTIKPPVVRDRPYDNPVTAKAQSGKLISNIIQALGGRRVSGTNQDLSTIHGQLVRLREGISGADIVAEDVIRVFSLAFDGPLLGLLNAQINRGSTDIQHLWHSFLQYLNQNNDLASLQSRLTALISRPSNQIAVDMTETLFVSVQTAGGLSRSNVQSSLNQSMTHALILVEKLAPAARPAIIQKLIPAIQLLERRVATQGHLTPTQKSQLHPHSLLMQVSATCIPQFWSVGPGTNEIAGLPVGGGFDALATETGGGSLAMGGRQIDVATNDTHKKRGERTGGLPSSSPRIGTPAERQISAWNHVFEKPLYTYKADLNAANRGIRENRVRQKARRMRNARGEEVFVVEDGHGNYEVLEEIGAAVEANEMDALKAYEENYKKDFGPPARNGQQSGPSMPRRSPGRWAHLAGKCWKCGRGCRANTCLAYPEGLTDTVCNSCGLRHKTENCRANSIPGHGHGWTDGGPSGANTGPTSRALDYQPDRSMRRD